MGARKFIFILLTLVVTDPFLDLDYETPNAYYFDNHPEELGIEVVEPEPEPVRTPGQAVGEIIDSWARDFADLGIPYSRGGNWGANR